MVVLGVADNHDAGAALVVGGEVVAAVGQERLDRIKNSGAFPTQAIDACLHLGGITPQDIDKIAIGTTFTPAGVLRWFRPFHHQLKAESSQFSYLLHLYILYQVALKSGHLGRLEELISLPVLRKELRRSGLRAPIHFVDHHTSHAATAYYSSGEERALVITLDAMGDGVSVTIHRGEEGKLIPLYQQSGLSAINTLYSRVTEWLGFIPLRHEGKITGLAAYATPPAKLVAHFRQKLHFVGPGFSRENYLRRASRDDPWHHFLGRYTREEIAASVQKNLEVEVCHFVRYWMEKSGIRHVAAAGGVFANVKLNQRIAEIPGIESVFVYPNMSDGGLAAGGALVVGDIKPRNLPHVYLGTDISDDDARTALEKAGLTYTRPADVEGEVAMLLAAGKVVARAAGRMEWGPRALGNRSILYKPNDPSINVWLNKHLKRTEFMPFAPSTVWEGAESRFRGLAPGKNTARFMTICFDATEEMARRCPGVIHVDGTARPQLVRLQDNPRFHHLLTRFGELTGEPTVINTSFNMHEEPIVASADDAVRAYQAAQLDALQVGNYLTVRDVMVR